MTTDCHVTGLAFEQAMGWWEEMVGPGRPVDTERAFVVCPNLLGGCYGTTGPRAPGPDGEPWLGRFPLTTPRDMMRGMKRLLHAIGIQRVARVVGPSMGGMIAWEWATDDGGAGERAHPADAIEAREVVVVAAPPAASALEIGLNYVQREGLALDDAMDAARGDGARPSRKGYGVARAAGMLSYRAPVGLAEKFGREWFSPPGRTLDEPGVFNVESWLKHHGKRLAKRFDPWTYRVYSRAMDLHDVAVGREGESPWAARGNARVLAVGIRSDCLYPAPEVRAGVDALRDAGRDATYAEIDSEHGHDAFLLDTDPLGRILGDWVRD